LFLWCFVFVWGRSLVEKWLWFVREWLVKWGGLSEIWICRGERRGRIGDGDDGLESFKILEVRGISEMCSKKNDDNSISIIIYDLVTGIYVFCFFLTLWL
jgi:hypothetical protein